MKCDKKEVKKRQEVTNEFVFVVLFHGWQWTLF